MADCHSKIKKNRRATEKIGRRIKDALHKLKGCENNKATKTKGQVWHIVIYINPSSGVAGEHMFSGIDASRLHGVWLARLGTNGHIGEGKYTADRDDDITIVRAFILFMMGYLWFQTSNDTVPLGYLMAVDDLDKAAQYGWGSTILASLYHGLDTVVTTGGAITGFSQLLTYWFYEYCRVVTLLSKKMLSSRPIRTSEHGSGGTEIK
ncbi:hypothetical protein GIB67_003066 [Kingdonia uniflora]|uniref:Aminotransferase-like plant mobile domain-containing protein n=1 Tax=Kingdonia uniflora TaxID=39325 RepID=A0A7J7N671_9MAGN|nr:hypothetical protein GIB67_003066 [Kingdonia uniflora]